MKDMLRQMLHEAQEAYKAAQEQQAQRPRPQGFPGSSGRMPPGDAPSRGPAIEQDVVRDRYPERMADAREVRRDIYPERTIEMDVTARRSRPVETRRTKPDSRLARAGALRRVLASPGSLQTAFLVREVLGPPVALREERDPFEI